jgi:toxin YoeB
MEFNIEYTSRAIADIFELKKSGNKNTIKKIEKLLEELKTNPTEGTGNPEPLKYELSGAWSRRLNSKDRLVYVIKDSIIPILLIK